MFILREIGVNITTLLARPKVLGRCTVLRRLVWVLGLETKRREQGSRAPNVVIYRWKYTRRI